MSWKLSALDKGFYEQNLRDAVALLESVQSCFELSIHFYVFAAGSRERRYRQMYGKFKTEQKATGCFLARLHFSFFFSVISFA